ncbi:MAG: TetR/AcrR family transcriptional regulator, partial [Clostridiales bacterium]|nr:TetR/AcrR family transcriptional regulator [Clostridiales bacterium]
WADSDFYESEIGSAGMMRAFMARRCDKYFTLRKKIRRFLDMSLKTYNVPEALREEAAGFV